MDRDEREHQVAIGHLETLLRARIESREERRQAGRMLGLIELDADVRSLVASLRETAGGNPPEWAGIAENLGRLLPIDTVEKAGKAKAALEYFEQDIAENE